MISIGDVKWGNRIEPINIHRLPKEELDNILEECGIELNKNTSYPIDERLVNVFRADKQKLLEYIEACQCANDKKTGKHVKKRELQDFSIFDDSLQINYELKHLRETVMIDEEEKTEIYRTAKHTQSLFKMFGANNVRVDINLLDRVYFEVQNFIQTVKAKRNIKALPEGTNQISTGEKTVPSIEDTYRKTFFNKEAQQATRKISEQWQEQPNSHSDKKEREII